MASNTSLTPLSEADYGAIEAAVMETGRGRWFLAEFAKRNRTADTQVLLAALERLETAVGGGGGAQQQVGRIQSDLAEMASMISQLKLELAADSPDENPIGQVTEALDAVVKSTEKATSKILESAEQIQEIAWTLRETGADVAQCDTLDQRAADIYTACGFQDLTAQSTAKVVRTLRAIEGRLNGLIDSWTMNRSAQPAPAIEAPAPAASGPLQHIRAEFPSPNDKQMVRRHLYSPVPVATPALSQDDIDVVIIGDETCDIDEEHFNAGFQRADVLPEEKDLVEGDLMLIDHDPDGLHTSPDMTDLDLAPPPADQPAPALGLAEIDTLPAREKLGIFS